MYTFTRFHPTMTREDNFNALNDNFAQIENQSAKSEGVWRAWKPTVVGFTTAPADAVYRYMQIGTTVTVAISMPTSSTSNSVNLTISAPVPSADIAGGYWEVLARTVDAGAPPAFGIAFIESGSPTIKVYPYTSGTTWTATGQKRVINILLTYEAQA